MHNIKRKIKRVLYRFMPTVKEPVYIPILESHLLEKRTVLITGGSGGIGKAIAIACASNGAAVVITGRDIGRLKQAQLEICKKSMSGAVYTYILDISDVKEFERKIDDIVALVPNHQIDTLINNAGIDSGGGMIPYTREEDYDKTLETNLKGTYFLTQAFSKYLIQESIQGNILNISSSSSVRPAVTPYMYSKWAIVGLTKGLGKRLIGNGIVVNGIGPGPTATSMLGIDGSNLYNKKSPVKRFAAPSEIANLAVFLISDMARMIVGETIYITGGSGTLTFDDIDYELK